MFKTARCSLLLILAVGLLPINHGDNHIDVVDEMFKAYIGHSVRESQDMQRGRRDRLTMLNISSNLAAYLINNGSLVFTKKSENITTTENPMSVLATLAPNETKVAAYSKKDFQQRRKNRELEEILRTPNGLQEFLNGDDFDTLTRRFDSIPLVHTRRKIKKPRVPGKASPEEKRIRDIKKWAPLWKKNSWFFNYDYPYFMNGYKYTLEKNKTIQIMHSLVHETRYNLIYPQVLRKKYHKSIRYRLGYLFGMLRFLKRQMKLVYHELRKAWYLLYSLYPALKLYDKLSRLVTDANDVSRLILQYEQLRKMEEEPDYYDLFPSSTAPKWRRLNVQNIKKRKKFNERV